jgi:NAD(P)-dependent dehydrogenase (short-subunit alcohol dehydrogenase family)
VTGAGGGLGRALIRTFYQRGFNLIALGRTQSKLDSALDSCRTIDSKGKMFSIRCDVRNEESIVVALRALKRSIGRIDVLVNNAGIRVEAGVETMSLRSWSESIQTNLSGTFLMTKHCLPLLEKSKAPVIVNISSIRGLFGGRDLAAYCASKFGIIGLTQSIAEEYADTVLRIYAVCPAAIDTEMIRATNHGVPEGQLLHADEVAQVIYQVTESAVRPSGQTIVIIGKQKDALRRILARRDYDIMQWG